MQNVLNIACHIQCPINLNLFDAPAWARRLEIQRIIKYLRGLHNTQRPFVPSRWSLGVLIQAEIVSIPSSIQFPALLDERVFEESDRFPWFHVWIFLPWLLTGLLYSGLFLGGAETTVFPNTESQAWGVPCIWTSCSGDSFRPGNLGGSFESYKLNAAEKSLREHQIQSPSSFLTLRPGVAQWLNHLRQRQD